MKTIKSKLLALFSTVVLFTFALMAIIIFQYNAYLADTSILQQKIADIQHLSSQTNIGFLQQSRAWKNILLRGHNDALYQQHVEEFKQLSTEIQANVERLKTHSSDTPVLHQAASVFGDALAVMTSRYLEALPVYKLAEHKPHVTADKYVRGVNNEAIELLAVLQQVTEDYRLSQQAMIDTRLKQMQLLVVLSGVLIIAVIAYIFIFTIRKGIFIPLNNATNLMKSIAEGERDLTLRMDTSKADEISTLSSWYNKFLDNVHELMEQINQTASSLATASNNTSRITADTNQAIRIQQEAIAHVSESMTDMAGRVTLIASNAGIASRAATDARDIANTGYAVVLDATKSIDQLTEDTIQAEQVINHLAEQSNNIGSIVNSITQISDQTNLLALNAAIEAARAGEHGRGFAVVAEEVRALASKTQLATEEIQNMIRGIQTEITSASSAMERSRSQAQKTVTLSSEAGNALTQITESIDNIYSLNTEIAQASQDISTKAQDIDTNIISINHSVEHTIDNSMKSTSENGDLAQLSLLLHSLISQFKIAEDVVEEITHASHHDDSVELF